MNVKDLPQGSVFLLAGREYRIEKQGIATCRVVIVSPPASPDDYFVRGDFCISREALVDGVIEMGEAGR